MNFKSIACFKGLMQGKQRDSKGGFQFQGSLSLPGFFPEPS